MVSSGIIAGIPGGGGGGGGGTSAGDIVIGSTYPPMIENVQFL